MELAPDETRTVAIAVPVELLGRSADDGTLTIEPGPVEILVGASATDIQLRAEFTVTGETATQPRRRVFFSETALR